MKFTKLPVTIDAFEVTAALTWFKADAEADGHAGEHGTIPDWLREAFMADVLVLAEPAVIIVTDEGRMRGDPGDWIIRGVNGELYPCKPDVFAKTYRQADQGEALLSELDPTELFMLAEPHAPTAFFTRLRAIIHDESLEPRNRLQSLDNEISFVSDAPAPERPAGARRISLRDGPVRTPEELFKEKGEQLVGMANAIGLNLTIHRQPKLPLAMKHVEPVVTVWPAKW
ncbi:MAG: hypothetical protein V4451_04830 [Pseudomonadota bacterium]